MIVDISMWKPFRLSDLFGAAKHGTYVNPRHLLSDVNGFTIVSASTKNNGVSDDRYACDELSLIPSGVITWGKQSPLFAYQTEATIPGQGVYYYDVTALSECQALFICSVMQSAVTGKYDYQECLIGSKMDNEFVLLPVTPDGEPDWAYMETYMQQVLDREEMFAEHLASLTAEAVADGHVVDTSTWKMFRVGDLFDIHPTRAYKMTNNVLMDGGCTPVVVNSAMNNGIGGFTTQAATESGHIITFSDTTTGDAIFYQSEPFVGYSHVQGMYPRGDYANCWSDFSLMFFTVVFRAVAMACAFDYSNKFRRDVAVDMNVKLPVTPDGAPDWAYMEQYMKDVMAVEALFADELDRVYSS